MGSNEKQIVTFRESDLARFATISHDRNPMHGDPQYARRTPFGQCVVFGMLGAMAAMREMLKGSPVVLRRFAATFKRPLFVEVPYEITTELTSHGKLALSIGRGGVERLRLDIDYELGGAPWSADRSGAGHAERHAPADPQLAIGLAAAGEYELAGASLDDFKKEFGFKYAFIPQHQLTALLWSSYFVGMELPGKQALYLGCVIDFEKLAAPAGPRIKYQATVASYDDKTSTAKMAAELSTSAGLLARVQLEAAQRPPPIAYTFAALEQKVPRSRALAGKLALVTGSSRGLGSLLAIGCALEGADVILNCRQGRDEAERVAAHIVALGSKATIVQGELEERATWLAMRAAIAERGLDLFFNNAFPPLVPAMFTELSEADVDRYLQVVKATVVGLQVLLPALTHSGGAVINISSEATQNPPRELSSYVLAKSAIEGLMLALAKEQATIRFLTARPPRLLTDMTNGLVGAFQGRSPEGVVAAILRAIPAAGSQDNYVVVDRFD